MSGPWLHQVRLHFDAAGAAGWRAGEARFAGLVAALAGCEGQLVSQLEAFEAFLAEDGAGETPLGRWTAATLAEPSKRAEHGRVFAVRVGGEALYPEAVADSVAAALAPFVGSLGIELLSRHDNDPATRMGVPREFGG